MGPPLQRRFAACSRDYGGARVSDAAFCVGQVAVVSPAVWVVPYVFGNQLVFMAVADDVFIVVSLPKPFVEWRPSVVLYAMYVFVGCHGFQPLHSGVDSVCMFLLRDLPNAMYVVGHYCHFMACDVDEFLFGFSYPFGDHCACVV